MESCSKCRKNFVVRHQHVSRCKIDYFQPNLSVKIIRLQFDLEPNDESGANIDAAKMWRENRVEFDRIAARIVRKSLNIP